MIAPDFVTRGVAAPADDSLVALCERAADAGFALSLERLDGRWRAVIERPGLFAYAHNARLDIALMDVIAKLPALEATHA